MNTIDFSLNGQRCQATKCETGVIITFIDKIVTDPNPYSLTTEKHGGCYDSDSPYNSW